MKAGMEPAARECRVGVLNGGDTGKFVLGNGRDHLVQPPSPVVGTDMILVRLRENVSTLLGPERTTGGCLSEPLLEVRVLGLAPGMAWPRIPDGALWGVVAGVGFVGCGLVVC